MGNIVKFKPNIDYYYSRGLSAYESDNYIEALKNYREAYLLAKNGADIDFRSVLEVEMACCYRGLQLFRDAQLYYYKALADSNPDSAFDSIIGLVDIFGTLNNEEALRYYMDMAAKRGFSRELDYIEAAAQFFSQCDYRVEPSPDKNMLELGRKLIEAEEFAFARQLLEVIPPSSPSYGEACMLLATLHNVYTGDSEKALHYLQQVGSAAPRADILVHTALALKRAGRTEEYESVIDEIACIDTTDVTLLSHIVHAMAMLGNEELVIKFGKRLAGISPQRIPMLCYAIALNNTGDLREARKIMVLLQALYPFDAATLVFSSLIGRQGAPQRYSLMAELPDGTEASMLHELNDVLSSCENDRDLLRQKLSDPYLRTAVLMVFRAGNDNSKRILADIVAEIPYFEEFIRDSLMDPGYPDADKRILLSVALNRLRRRPLYLTSHDICRPLFGHPPAKTVGKWREAYCLAYGAIALFGCEDFERAFDSVFTKCKNAINEADIDVAAAAAVIVNRLKSVPPLKKDECCIELFGADRDAYFAYKELLRAPVGEQSVKRPQARKTRHPR